MCVRKLGRWNSDVMRQLGGCEAYAQFRQRRQLWQAASCIYVLENEALDERARDSTGCRAAQIMISSDSSVYAKVKGIWQTMQASGMPRFLCICRLV